MTRPAPGAIAAILAAVAAGAAGAQENDGEAERLQRAIEHGAREIARRAAEVRGIPLPDTPLAVLAVPWEEMPELQTPFAREVSASPDLTRREAFLRLLGLLPASTRLAEVYGQFTESGAAAAWFNPDSRKMIVSTFGSWRERSPAIFHESIHWLEDARYGTGDRVRVLEHMDDPLLAYRSLLEGTATVCTVESLLLSQGRPRSFDGSIGDLVRANEPLRSAPGNLDVLDAHGTALRELLLSPYADGADFVQALRRSLSWKEFDRVFEDPPASMEEILHPEKYLAAPRGRAEKIELPLDEIEEALGEDVRFLGEGTAGELALRLRTDPKAAEGWAGDRYAVYRMPEGAEVLAWKVVFDSDADAREFNGTFPGHVGKLSLVVEKRTVIIMVAPDDVVAKAFERIYAALAR